MIAKMISAYIKDKGIKQRAVASKAGISEQTLSDILNGRRQLKADVFAQICDALEVNADAFMIKKEERECNK